MATSYVKRRHSPGKTHRHNAAYPVSLYERIRRSAQSHQRSVTAEIEVAIERYLAPIEATPRCELHPGEPVMQRVTTTCTACGLVLSDRITTHESAVPSATAVALAV